MILLRQSVKLLKTLKAKCRGLKSQSWVYIQSKMPRPCIPTHSKMPMKSGARYSRCGADAALQQRGTSGTAPRNKKYFTNRFAVEYKGSDEIDQPMQLSGKSVDRRALGFKTCAIGRLASTNSSMISVLSSNKQKSPLIAERSAASFPCGPVRLVVIRTN